MKMELLRCPNLYNTWIDKRKKPDDILNKLINKEKLKCRISMAMQVYTGHGDAWKSTFLFSHLAHVNMNSNVKLFTQHMLEMC
jgi:hypothetical protein